MRRHPVATVGAVDNVRVLHLHTKYREAGGEDAVVARERKYLSEHGFDVTALDFVNSTERFRAVGALGASVWNPLSYRKASKSIAASGPDVAHVHNTWFDASWSVLDAIDAACPAVMTVHNYRQVCLNAYLFRDGRACTSCVDGTLLTGVRHACYRNSQLSSAILATNLTIHRRRKTVARTIDRVLVLSDFAGSLLSQAAGIPEEKISRINNAASDPGPRPLPPSASSDILTLGRLSPEKGFDLLIHAWRAMPETSGYRLRILGDGPDRERLEALADGDGSVVFEGRANSSAVRAAMLSSRALVVPSRWFEGQPLVVVEALAASLPVIALPQPPLVELLAGAGQTVAAGVDARALVDALGVLDEPAALDEAAIRARRRYEERHHPDVVGRELQSIYRSLL